MKRISLSTCALLALSALHAAHAQSGADDPRLKLVQDTLLIAVTNFTGPASTFVEDKDPNTLQIVFLQKAEQGDSHVSDDGEVVFLSPGASQTIQQELITAAFDLRVQKHFAETGAGQ